MRAPVGAERSGRDGAAGGGGLSSPSARPEHDRCHEAHEHEHHGDEYEEDVPRLGQLALIGT